jgi:hypothetical protein
MNQCASEQSIHWSKDFVEHLRAVHFALIAVSAGLILLVLSSKEYNAATALVQLEDLLEMKKHWSLDWMEARSEPIGEIDARDRVDKALVDAKHGKEAIVHVRTDSIVPRFLHENLRYRLGVYPEDYLANSSVTFECTMPKFNWFVTSSILPTDSSLTLKDHEGLNTRFYLDFHTGWSTDNTRFPRTPQDLENWWGRIDDPIYLPNRFSEDWIVDDPQFVSELERWLKNAGPRDRTIIVKLELRLTRPTLYSTKSPEQQLAAGWVQGRYVGTFNWQGKERTLTIPITGYERMSLGPAIRQSLGIVGPGKFNRNLRDLALATQAEGGLPLETIKEFLHDEASKGPEVFEAFGMKFPQGHIILWGDILLLGVQVYLFIYLRQLWRKLKPGDPGWDVPWIGMDSSGLSQTILFVSLTMVPGVAAALLCQQAINHLLGGTRDGWMYLKIIVLVFATVTSMVLGILCWCHRPRLRPGVPSCSPQLFE